MWLILLCPGWHDCVYKSEEVRKLNSCDITHTIVGMPYYVPPVYRNGTFDYFILLYVGNAHYVHEYFHRRYYFQSVPGCGYNIIIQGRNKTGEVISQLFHVFMHIALLAAVA